MKVLFVCRANVGRSQMAEVFYNQLSSFESTSTGTNVDESDGKTVSYHAQTSANAGLVVEIMAEEGLDIGSKQRTQLTAGMVNAADKVIVMAAREYWPDYLVEGGKVVFWNITDPVNMPKSEAETIKDQVKAMVEELVRETG